MEADERRKWTLLTSHGHVLVEIARNPRARVRDISAIIGITERATQAIIADLERAGYVERVRIGRRTRYVVHADNPFRHSAQDGLQVGPFLDLLTGATEPSAPTPAVPTPKQHFLAAAVLSFDGGTNVSPLESVAVNPGPEPAEPLTPASVSPLDPAEPTLLTPTPPPVARPDLPDPGLR